ncbi:MAG: hypothetical protein HY670_00175 [Chloroflexi bacterium]|nr:hypothetical protein [Chloroflexota bacterium]
MSHIIKYGIILALVAMLAMGLSVNGSPALANAGTGSGIQIVTMIKGLEAGDKAILDVSTEGEMSHENAIASKTVVGDGKVMYVTLSADLKDGSYQVAIDATDKYFRQPRGYFFAVLDSKIYNPDNRTIAFELIPPTARDYEPSRNSFHFAPVTKVVAPPATSDIGTRPIRSEPFRDLSAPKKEPIPNLGEHVTTSVKYYENYGTDYSNHGLFGVLTPVDTGVSPHSSPTSTDFVVGHVYSQNTSGGRIEGGWVDASWKDDNRYIYTHNSVENIWEYHGTVSDNSYLNIYTVLDSGTTWKVYYYDGDWGWVELDSADVGMSSANETFLGFEVDDAAAPPPSFPRSDIVNAALLVYNGSYYYWDTWDTGYYTVPFHVPNDSPYHKHVTSSYYDWYAHTD